MRVFCVSDVHASERALEAVEKTLSAEKPDLLLVAGDTAHQGKSGFIKKFLDSVEKTNVPILAVPGNMDEESVWKTLEKKGVSIHAKKTVFGGVSFAGFGGSPHCPSPTPMEYDDEELYDSISGLVDWQTIVVSHAPPFNTKADIVRSGEHVGCKSLRKLIEEKQPLACVSGHIHETEGTDKIGDTMIVKVGAGKDGRAAWLELPSLKADYVKLF